MSPVGRADVSFSLLAFERLDVTAVALFEFPQHKEMQIAASTTGMQRFLNNIAQSLKEFSLTTTIQISKDEIVVLVSIYRFRKNKV